MNTNCTHWIRIRRRIIIILTTTTTRIRRTWIATCVPRWCYVSFLTICRIFDIGSRGLITAVYIRRCTTIVIGYRTTKWRSDWPNVLVTWWDSMRTAVDWRWRWSSTRSFTKKFGFITIDCLWIDFRTVLSKIILRISTDYTSVFILSMNMCFWRIVMNNEITLLSASMRKKKFRNREFVIEKSYWAIGGARSTRTRRGPGDL